VPQNTLHKQDFNIGCAPCSTISEDEDIRAGDGGGMSPKVDYKKISY
jgi:hypothetical protein